MRILIIIALLAGVTIALRRRIANVFVSGIGAARADMRSVATSTADWVVGLGASDPKGHGARNIARRLCEKAPPDGLRGLLNRSEEDSSNRSVARGMDLHGDSKDDDG